MVAIRRKKGVVSGGSAEAPLGGAARSPTLQNENLNPMLDEEAGGGGADTSSASAPTEPLWSQTPVAPSAAPAPAPGGRGMLSSMMSAPSRPQTRE
jgi:hypothetical protein